MLGSFLVNKVWSDGFCERYALVKWIEKKIDIGVYFLINNKDVIIGDVLRGELVIDCAKKTIPMRFNGNLEMSIHFDSIHDTCIRANVVIKSIENNNIVYGYINSVFSDIKINLIDEGLSDRLSFGDEMTINGLLTLELSE